MSSKVLFRKAPGVLLKNQTLAKTGGGTWPHLYDVYIPNGPVKFVAVILHGGGGSKENIAQTMGITYSLTATVNQVNWPMLELFKTMVVIPQGQHCDGTVGPFNPNGANTVSTQYPNGVATWSNYFMWSGADDLSMLKDMSTFLATTRTGTARILMGHSNGGMMTERVWLEAPGYYNFYATFSGPLARYYDQATFPQPAQLKPLYQRFSLKDTILGISGGNAGPGDHFWDNQWNQQWAQSSVANYEYPNLGGWVGGWRIHAALSSWLGQTFDPNAYTQVNVAKGWVRTWDYKVSSTQRVTMEVLSEGAHSLVDQTKATRQYSFAAAMKWAFTSFI